MDNLDNKYLAGLYDGEGSLTIHKRKLSKNTTYGYVFQPKIRIGMTGAEELIKNIQARFGGTFHLRSYGNKYKDLLNLNIASEKNILKFIKEVSPYLIIKKGQAEIIEEFYSKATKQKDWKSQKMPQAEMERRFGLYLEIQKLNMKCKDTTNND
jgi:hypothetical protein